MHEAASTKHAGPLRALFAHLLVFNKVQDPVKMWNDFKIDLCDDFLYRARIDDPTRQLDYDIEDKALWDIDRNLKHMSTGGLQQFGLPLPTSQPVQVSADPLQEMVESEKAKYSRVSQANLRDSSVVKLNEQQNSMYWAVLKAVYGPEVVGAEQDRVSGLRRHDVAAMSDSLNAAASSRSGIFFFVDGLGGAGKTFTYTCLLSNICARGDIAIAVASSGIAALLLPGGRTAHSRLKVPLRLDRDSICAIGPNTQLGRLIKAAKLIVWDEAPMTHKHAYEALDRTLRDIMGTVDPANMDKVFGGKVVVLGGDFRQILPVVRRGTRGSIVAASLNQSVRLWPFDRVFKLHKNMRVDTMRRQGNVESALHQERFAEYLQRVGDGREAVYGVVGPDMVLIPPQLCCSGGPDATEDDLIRDVYEGIDAFHSPASRGEFICQRAILTPLNADVDRLNNKILSMYPMLAEDGTAVETRVYKSADRVLAGEQQGLYPVEFLNSLNLAGVPPHELRLQVGAPIILLRNMAGGLANGTRLVVSKLMDTVIEAKVTTGPRKGQFVLIPRLRITPPDVESLPFTLERLQFPVRAAYAMTINKSQGQTLCTVGVFLPKPVFSHGQLYVAFSRVGTPEGVKVLAVGGYRPAGPGVVEGFYTKNVVYREVFHPARA